MPSLTLLQHHPRTLLLTAAALPLALAVADDVRLRRQLVVAGRDELTGLPRRQELTDRGEQLLARRRDDDVLVLVCDGDGFKQINDTFGHAAGDQVVVTLAQRLRQWATGHQGMAARLGGDEFAAVVLLPRDRFTPQLTALRAHLNRPVPFEGQLLPLSVSVGAAYAADLPGRPFGDVLRAADTSMYRVKTKPAAFPDLGTSDDADAPAVNGRRPGRPGTHLAGQARLHAAAGAAR
jgi:diguanylate cyclase (GGDEF)-like protein